jgi:pimeloyl-ACP methyl ester carboxylesterase
MAEGGEGRRAGRDRRVWRVAARRPLRTLAAGEGPPVVMFPGFAMRPELYSATARELVRRGRSVMCFDVMSRPGPWDADAVEAAAAAVLDQLGVGPAHMVAHSFGGAIQLGLVARRPDLARTLVFSDTLALSSGLRLAEEALGITALVRLATSGAARSFARTVASRPRTVAGAAWWGFRSNRTAETDSVARSGIPCHVVWAERDTLLSRDEGEAFARRLGAQFAVLASGPAGGPTDHDAMYRHPRLFAAALDQIGALG